MFLNYIELLYPKTKETSLDITGFKIRHVALPVGLTDEQVNRTPLSEFKEWVTKEGTFTFGGVYYDSSKQSILSQITDMLLTGRGKDKQKMKILEQHAQNITAPEEISIKADMSLQNVLARTDEIIAEGYSHDYYESAQLIKKIRANSLYGALGNVYFHLYNLINAMNVTLSGQELIKMLSDMFNNYFKNEFYKDKRYFPVESETNRCTKDVVCLIDTDSVTGDTLIPVMQNEVVSEAPIESILTSMRPDNAPEKEYEKYEITEGRLALSLNRLTGEKEWKPIKNVVKHKVKKELFEITVNGRSVIVTCDHSLIVLRNGIYIDIKPAEVIPTDSLTYIREN